MKTSKISTMPRPPKVHPSNEQIIIFNQLQELIKVYATYCDVRVNTSTQYELWTCHPFRTKSFRPKTQKGILFTGILICKPHVGMYFYPFHVNAELKNKLLPELESHLMIGSAFHFKELTPTLIDQIKSLLQIGWEDYSVKGWI